MNLLWRFIRDEMEDKELKEWKKIGDGEGHPQAEMSPKDLIIFLFGKTREEEDDKQGVGDLATEDNPEWRICGKERRQGMGKKIETQMKRNEEQDKEEK